MTCSKLFDGYSDTRGLGFRLASNQCNVIAASGITSVSVWYTSTNRDSQNRDKWKQTLTRLIEILLWTNRADNDNNISVQGDPPTQSNLCDDNEMHDDDDHNTPGVPNKTHVQGLDSDVFASLVLTLPIEMSHWRWDLSSLEKTEVLEPLLGLFEAGLLEGPAVVGASITLAVLAMLANDHQNIPVNEVQVLRPVDDVLHNVEKIYSEWEETYRSRSPFQEPRGLAQLNHLEVRKTDRHQRSRHAQWTAYLCVMDPRYSSNYSDALLVFGLAGLLDLAAEPGLSDSTFATRITKIVAAQLEKTYAVNQLGPITLPCILPGTYDIRIYLADVITRALDLSPFEDRLDPPPVHAKAALLRCLSEKKNLWFDFGSQLLIPVVQLLHDNNDVHLQALCLAALDEYCLTNSVVGQETTLRSSIYHNPIDWQFFFAFDIPHKLVSIAHENAGLRSRAISSFYSLMLVIPTEDQDSEAARHVSNAVKRIISDGLLEAFTTEIVCRSGHQHSEIWRNQIIHLPDILQPEDAEDAHVLAHLRDFCQNHPKESGHMHTIIFALKGKLKMHEQ